MNPLFIFTGIAGIIGLYVWNQKRKSSIPSNVNSITEKYVYQDKDGNRFLNDIGVAYLLKKIEGAYLSLGDLQLEKTGYTDDAGDPVDAYWMKGTIDLSSFSKSGENEAKKNLIDLVKIRYMTIFAYQADSDTVYVYAANFAAFPKFSKQPPWAVFLQPKSDA